MTRRPFNPDDLADQLDLRIASGQTEPISPAEGIDDPLIEAAIRLTNASHPQLSAKAMDRIQREMLAVSAAKQRQFFRPATYLLIAACMIVVLFLVNPLIVKSVAGDTLYPVKRTFERVELAAAKLLQNEVSVRLKHAERRVHEVTILVDRGQFDAELIDESLAQISQIANHIEPGEIQMVQDRVERISNRLDDIIITAEGSNLVTATTLAKVRTEMQTLRDNHPVLFAAPQPEPEMLPSETPSATPTQTLTMTQIPSATEKTATATATSPPTATTPPTETVVPSPQPTVAHVTGNGVVNVRQGPGLNFPVIGQVRSGDSLTVIGENNIGDWLQVQLSTGLEGWIAQRLIQIGDTPPTITIPNTGAGDNANPRGETGRPEGAGPPDGVGPPEDVGPPRDVGPPDGAGPPADPGPPDNPRSPGNR